MDYTVNIDHFILGIDDLEKGMKDFAKKTGVEPIFGGVHEGAGTHNALVSLENGQYLEILAPLKKGSQTGFGTFNYPELTPIGWILNTNHSEAITPILDQFGVAHSGIRPLSRKTSEGKLLKWTNIFHHFYGQPSLNPFFIEWHKETPHPSLTTPQGCTLKSFHLSLNDENNIIEFLQSFNVQLTFEKSNRQSGELIQLELNTPNGIVNFS